MPHRNLWPRSARDALALSFQENKPRRRLAAATPTHPLLGDAPTLQLMRTNTMGGYIAPSEHGTVRSEVAGSVPCSC